MNLSTPTTRELLTVKDVARLYGCSLSTAKRHCQRAKQKAGLTGRVRLTVDEFCAYSRLTRERVKEGL